jgi:uncharacterized membrane protein YqhA
VSPTIEKKAQRALLARMIGGTKYIMVVAVIGIFIGSMVLLISSAIQMFTSVWDVLFGDPNYHGDELRVDLIESVDTVLVATVLYMIAIGLYQLFINRSLELPSWLQTDGLEDLETRLGGMVITVLSVIFVTVALESRGEKDILNFGLAIAAIVLAVSVFLFVEGKHSHHESGKIEE